MKKPAKRDAIEQGKPAEEKDDKTLGINAAVRDVLGKINQIELGVNAPAQGQPSQPGKERPAFHQQQHHLYKGGEAAAVQGKALQAN
jgi:hypothetical protein